MEPDDEDQTLMAMRNLGLALDAADTQQAWGLDAALLGLSVKPTSPGAAPFNPRPPGEAAGGRPARPSSRRHAQVVTSSTSSTTKPVVVTSRSRSRSPSRESSLSGLSPRSQLFSIPPPLATANRIMAQARAAGQNFKNDMESVRRQLERERLRQMGEMAKRWMHPTDDDAHDPQDSPVVLSDDDDDSSASSLTSPRSSSAKRLSPRSPTASSATTAHQPLARRPKSAGIARPETSALPNRPNSAATSRYSSAAKRNIVAAIYAPRDRTSSAAASASRQRPVSGSSKASSSVPVRPSDTARRRRPQSAPIPRHMDTQSQPKSPRRPQSAVSPPRHVMPTFVTTGKPFFLQAHGKFGPSPYAAPVSARTRQLLSEPPSHRRPKSGKSPRSPRPSKSPRSSYNKVLPGSPRNARPSGLILGMDTALPRVPSSPVRVQARRAAAAAISAPAAPDTLDQMIQTLARKLTLWVHSAGSVAQLDGTVQALELAILTYSYASARWFACGGSCRMGSTSQRVAFEEVVATYNEVAVRALRAGKLQQAHALIGRCERITLSGLPAAQTPWDQASTNAIRSRLLAVTLNNAACIYNEMGQIDDAIRALQSSMKLEGGTIVSAAAAEGRSRTLLNLSSLYGACGRDDLAAQYRDAAANVLRMSPASDAGPRVVAAVPPPAHTHVSPVPEDDASDDAAEDEQDEDEDEDEDVGAYEDDAAIVRTRLGGRRTSPHTGRDEDSDSGDDEVPVAPADPHHQSFDIAAAFATAASLLRE